MQDLFSSQVASESGGEGRPAGAPAARADLRDDANPPVPLQLRNAPTALLRAHGRGAGDLSPHDFEDNRVAHDYLRDALRGRMYYEPAGEGHERVLAERLANWRATRERYQQTGRSGLPPGGRTDKPGSG